MASNNIQDELPRTKTLSLKTDLEREITTNDLEHFTVK
jgi:hypothetical protein